MAGEVAPVDTPWDVGDRVGCYVLRAQIGRGGMSTVWDAWDTDLRRGVAIKTVDDPAESEALLVNEARALAAVRHRGLPAVYGLGRTEGRHGRRYLVLERLYGENLLQRLQRGGPFAVADALSLLIDVADVLDAVHQAGMVHHDVKPGNIMLCREQRTVLLDFGVMTPQVREANASRRGTPGYAAPEVMLDTLSVDRARLVDMYAFGVIAYEMLVGHAPFVGADVNALMESHAYAPPPQVRAVRSDVPEALNSLVLSCMAKNAADRPTDMEVVSGELRLLRRRLARHAATLPPASRPPPKR